jgi:beta-lactamase class A
MADPHKTFKAFEERLGQRAELGITASLFDSSARPKSEISWNGDRYFPMASVVKVPIGMALASEVATGAVSFNDHVGIASWTATPGPVTNSLDRLYFFPFDSARTETLGRLLRYALRQSDNTAADAILDRLGGISVVREFLSSSHIEEICLTRTIRELLTYYYDLPFALQADGHRPTVVERARRILATIRRLRSAYSCRMQQEEYLANSGEDTCTPNSMARLLMRLVTESQYRPVLEEMRRCTTGRSRIAKGIRNHAALVKSFAHKTGSLGSITNDVGIIEFHSGDIGIIVLMINKSSASLSIREQTIASIAGAVMAEWRHHVEAA